MVSAHVLWIDCLVTSSVIRIGGCSCLYTRRIALNPTLSFCMPRLSFDRCPLCLQVLLSDPNLCANRSLVEMDRLRPFAKSSGSLTPGEVQEMYLLCEALKHFLAQNMARVVYELQDKPMLMSYSSDCTPALVKKHIQAELATGKKVRRVGNQSEEFLVENCFLRWYDAEGRCQTRPALRDAVPLTEGKSAPALFAAGREHHKSLRALGHEGVAVQHYTFDRAALSALGRLFWQHLQQAAPPPGGSGSALSSPKMLQLLEWVVANGCAIHDGHNALKWSMHQHFRDSDLLKNIYIGVQSLRNSYGMLYEFLPSWLMTHVDLADESTLPDEETLQCSGQPWGPTPSWSSCCAATVWWPRRGA